MVKKACSQSHNRYYLTQSQYQDQDQYQEQYYLEDEMFDQATVLNFCLSSMIMGGATHASQHAVPVTVFVHGTSLVLGKIVYTPSGLHNFSKLSKIDVSYKFGLELARSDSLNFPLSDYYSFGWQGELDFKRRETAAEELAEQLLKLVEIYKKRGQRIKLTVITHSHGGNVALNLAKVVANLSPDQRQLLVIDRLIMLACPVQIKTRDYVHSLVFVNIYALYSKLDFIQVAAPQLSEFQNQLEQGEIPGSERVFPLDLRLKQAEIKAGWRPGIPHLEFIHPSFARKLPKILSRLDWYAEHSPTQAFLQGRLNLDIATL